MEFDSSSPFSLGRGHGCHVSMCVAEDSVARPLLSLLSHLPLVLNSNFMGSAAQYQSTELGMSKHSKAQNIEFERRCVYSKPRKQKPSSHQPPRQIHLSPIDACLQHRTARILFTVLSIRLLSLELHTVIRSHTYHSAGRYSHLGRTAPIGRWSSVKSRWLSA